MYTFYQEWRGGKGQSGHTDNVIPRPLLNAVKPWMAVDATAPDIAACEGKLESWSLLASDNTLVALCAVVETAGEFVTRGTSLSDEPAPNIGPLFDEGAAAASFLAHTWQGLLTKTPVVVCAPAAEFRTKAPLRRLLVFARAALPAPLRRNCRIRVFTRDPRLFLETLHADILAVPDDIAGEVLGIRRDAILLDRDGKHIDGVEPSPAIVAYAKVCVDEVLKLGSVGSFCQLADRLITEPAPPSDASLLNLLLEIGRWNEWRANPANRVPDRRLAARAWCASPYWRNHEPALEDWVSVVDDLGPAVEKADLTTMTDIEYRQLPFPPIAWFELEQGRDLLAVLKPEAKLAFLERFREVYPAIEVAPPAKWSDHAHEPKLALSMLVPELPKVTVGYLSLFVIGVAGEARRDPQWWFRLLRGMRDVANEDVRPAGEQLSAAFAVLRAESPRWPKDESAAFKKALDSVMMNPGTAQPPVTIYCGKDEWERSGARLAGNKWYISYCADGVNPQNGGFVVESTVEEEPRLRLIRYESPRWDPSRSAVMLKPNGVTESLAIDQPEIQTQLARGCHLLIPATYYSQARLERFLEDIAGLPKDQQLLLLNAWRDPAAVRRVDSTDTGSVIEQAPETTERPSFLRRLIK